MMSGARKIEDYCSEYDYWLSVAMADGFKCMSDDDLIDLRNASGFHGSGDRIIAIALEREMVRRMECRDE